MYFCQANLTRLWAQILEKQKKKKKDFGWTQIVAVIANKTEPVHECWVPTHFDSLLSKAGKPELQNSGGRWVKSSCQRLFQWLSSVGMRRSGLCVFSLVGREARGLGKPRHSVCTEEQWGFTVTQWTVRSLEVCLWTKLYTYWSRWWSKSGGLEAERREGQGAVGGVITHLLTVWLEY